MKIIALFVTIAIGVATAEVRTFTGLISDSMCSEDHKHMNAGPDPDCVRACVKAGEKYVLLDSKNKKVYRLSDQESPSKFAAKKVKVTGTLYEKTSVIKVDKIEALQ